MNVIANVELQVACASASIPPADAVRGWIEDAIGRSGIACGEFAVVVRIVDERESRALNYRFRDKDRPTNVLAFPAGDSRVAGGAGNGALRTLGDLAVCAPVVEREAREQGKPVDAHWAHLLVHGTLHLLGYDHLDEVAAVRMEALETEILAARGIGDPYH